MKTCFKCKAEKPMAEFYAHKMMADGHLNKCKQCTKTDVHKHRHGQGREKVLDYDRRRYKSNEVRRIKTGERTQKYRKEHPQVVDAHRIFTNAVRTGRLVPWPVCCVPTCDQKPEGHHYDYSKPLDVIWLCSAHHKQTHAISRKQA